MKIPFLAVAGAFLLPVVAESPHNLHALVQHATTSDPSIDCLGNMDLIPSHSGDNAMTRCTNTTYLGSLERCTRDYCSPAAADILDIIHSWCAEASVPLPPSQFSCSSSDASTHQKTDLKHKRAIDSSHQQRSTYNRYATRGSYGHQTGSISTAGMMGIIIGVLLVVILVISVLTQVNRNARMREMAALPVAEPRRGRESSASPVQGTNISREPAARARSPTPPPPYVPAPEAAHVKDNPGEPQPPSYEDRPSGSNVRM